MSVRISRSETVVLAMHRYAMQCQLTIAMQGELVDLESSQEKRNDTASERVAVFGDVLDQGWGNFLTDGPQWILKFDRGAGPATRSTSGANGHFKRGTISEGA